MSSIRYNLPNFRMQPYNVDFPKKGAIPSRILCYYVKEAQQNNQTYQEVADNLYDLFVKGIPPSYNSSLKPAQKNYYYYGQKLFVQFANDDFYKQFFSAHEDNFDVINDIIRGLNKNSCRYQEVAARALLTTQKGRSIFTQNFDDLFFKFVPQEKLSEIYEILNPLLSLLQYKPLNKKAISEKFKLLANFYNASQVSSTASKKLKDGFSECLDETTINKAYCVLNDTLFGRSHIINEFFKDDKKEVPSLSN